MTSYPRRIAFVLTAVHEGGLERFTGDLMDSLPREEFEPVLYVLTPNNPWINEFQRRGIEIRIYDASNAVRFRSLPSLLRAFLRLRKIGSSWSTLVISFRLRSVAWQLCFPASGSECTRCTAFMNGSPSGRTFSIGGYPNTRK